jgi:hypothetical protein
MDVTDSCNAKISAVKFEGMREGSMSVKLFKQRSLKRDGVGLKKYL